MLLLRGTLMMTRFRVRVSKADGKSSKRYCQVKGLGEFVPSDNRDVVNRSTRLRSKGEITCGTC